MTLKLQGICRRFGRTTVLDGIDLEVHDSVSLLGANGSGKTTLLRIAAGILRSQGTVTIQGQSVHMPAARRSIGYVGQQPALYDELTASEHLRWWTRLQGAPAPDVPRWLHDADLLDRPAGTMSRGQRQRLAIAMCFAAKPKILILDEPTNALDAAATAWFDGLLAAHAGPSLVAWHDEARAARAARTFRLQGGKLEAA